MTLLVTGASGFIGRALCAELLLHGYTVKASVRSLNARACIALEGTETIAVGAVDVSTDWHDALEDCDAIVHLASRVHVMTDKASDPLAEFRSVNVDGTLNLANEAANAGIRRFVFLSSVKVNGEQTLPGKPFTEQNAPAPLHSYAISKYEAEKGLQKLSSQSGMEVVIIRSPLVYGPGAKANILNMMRWLKKGVPLPLGAIDNRRSLIGLDNLIDFIITCLESPAAANQIFLVSDGEDVSSSSLLNRMATGLNVPARLFPFPKKILEAILMIVGRKDIAQRLYGSLQVDITKAKTNLGWYPPVSVDEGLHRMGEFYQFTEG